MKIAKQASTASKLPFFAEVVESSLYGWKSECWDFTTLPVFGSLVTVQTQQRTIFGIVHQSNTSSQDPARHVYAYQKTYEELVVEQPQIFAFLQTRFECLTVGFSQDDKIVYQIAPEHPQIHTFVRYASPEQSALFFSSPLYLSVLFEASNLQNLDELLLASMWNQRNQGRLTESAITAFIDHFSMLTGNDYRRVKLFMQRLEANNLLNQDKL